MISVLVDKSPLILLPSMGAMMVVLILVFHDMLLSLVASVTINSSDMLRAGDWIEMPQQGADGTVVDIALHTLKVKNWDQDHQCDSDQGMDQRCVQEVAWDAREWRATN